MDSYVNAIGHTYENGVCTVCGYTYTVNATVISQISIQCTVSGRTVTVTHDRACKVGYLVDGRYIAIEAVENNDGSYSFIAPAGVGEVFVAVKGDINANGKINSADKILIARAMLSEDHNLYLALTPKEFFAADIDSDGDLDSDDLTLLSKGLMPESSEQYCEIAW